MRHSVKQRSWCATRPPLLAIVMMLAIPGLQHVAAETPQCVGPLLIKLIDQVDVPALVEGQLVSMDVRLGTSVREGDVLATIDPEASETRLAIAETEYRVSTQKQSQYSEDKVLAKEYSEKRAAVEQQELIAEIAAKNAENDIRVLAAQKAEAVAKNEWQRAAKARNRFADSVSDSELESLRLKFERAQLETSQARFERRQDQLSSRAESHGVQVASLAADRAEIKQQVAVAGAKTLELEVLAKSQLVAMHKLDLKRHRVTSPLEGTVAEVYKQKGEWVRPGDSVFRVINLQHFYAEGFLTGNVRPKVGQTVRLQQSEKNTTGRVEFVSPEKDPVSGEFRFLVRLAGGVFLPGDRVDIDWNEP